MTVTPISIKEASRVFDHYKKETGRVKSNEHLTPEGKKAASLKIDNAINTHIAYWKQEVEEESQKLQEELDKIKPDNVNRSLTSDEVAVLSYQAKSLLSRLAAEGETSVSFLDILKEIVDEGDENTRQAFIDNYQEFLEVAGGFDHAGKDYIRDYYHRAKNHLKTPEQKAYEEAASENDTIIRKLNMQLLTVERNFADLKATISADVMVANFKPEEDPNLWSGSRS